MSERTIVDRNGAPVRVGQKIRVQTWALHQVNHVEGVIEQLYPQFPGATLRLTTEAYTHPNRINPGGRRYQVGEQFYATLPGEWKDREYVCKRTFVQYGPQYVGFKREWESWVEVLAATALSTPAPDRLDLQAR